MRDHTFDVALFGVDGKELEVKSVVVKKDSPV